MDRLKLGSGGDFQTRDGALLKYYQKGPKIAAQEAPIGAQSELALPVIFDSKPIAIFGFHSGKKNHFAPEHVRLVSRVADQLGPSIENSKLQQEMAVADDMARILTSDPAISRAYHRFASEIKTLRDEALAERIIFISGKPIGAEGRDLITSTGNPFLDKPFGLEELRAQIGLLTG